MKNLKEKIIEIIRQNPFEVRCDSGVEYNERANKLLSLFQTEIEKVVFNVIGEIHSKVGDFLENQTLREVRKILSLIKKGGAKN